MFLNRQPIFQLKLLRRDINNFQKAIKKRKQIKRQPDDIGVIWNNNIKINLRKIVWEYVHCMHMAQDRAGGDLW